MVKRYTLAALVLFWILCVPVAHAQNFVKLWNIDSAKPVSSTDPLPVTGSVSTITNPVKVVGVDGSTIMTNANPLVARTPTVTQANITGATGNVPNSDTAVPLTAASTHLCVKTDPAAAILYVDLTNNTATTADFRIDPGSCLCLDGLPGISSIHILGASATGTYSVAGW